MPLGGELEEEPSPELEGDPEDAGEMRGDAGEMRGDGLLGGVAGRVLRHDETILPADRIESDSPLLAGGGEGAPPSAWGGGGNLSNYLLVSVGQLPPPDTNAGSDPSPNSQRWSC